MRNSYPKGDIALQTLPPPWRLCWSAAPRGSDPVADVGHYHSTGLKDELCFCGEDRLGGVLNFSRNRTTGTHRFSRAEVETARIIAPLVIAALSSSWRAFLPGSVFRGLDPDDAHHRRLTHARLTSGDRC